ncbi:MAG: hypothetical protein JRM74_05675 [Nitrososphaerota archaeon]|nr:hypothetical protein [Nitrososphaerota archaeon]
MAVVKVDAHRRIYVPKEMDIEAEKVIIVKQGAAFLLIPVPRRPIEIDVKEGVPELKARADAAARADAMGRAKRRER